MSPGSSRRCGRGCIALWPDAAAGLACALCSPPPLTVDELVSVNLWMSLVSRLSAAFPTAPSSDLSVALPCPLQTGGSTTLHYDSDHNLLVVLRGRKQASSDCVLS